MRNDARMFGVRRMPARFYDRLIDITAERAVNDNAPALVRHNIDMRLLQMIAQRGENVPDTDK